MAAVLLVGLLWLVGCSSSPPDSPATSAPAQTVEPEKSEPIVLVVEPDESIAALEDMRSAFAEAVTEATGRKCEVMTTTDYNVAIEALVSGKAQMASLGAYEYVVAHDMNPAVEVGFAASNEKGDLSEASYYCFVAVRTEDADQYRDGDGYSLREIKGKDAAFVNLNSTSGYIIPSVVIQNEYGLEDTDKLTESDFFSSISFPGSHAGVMATLLEGDADVVAFGYMGGSSTELISGEPCTPGSVYRIAEGLDAPLDAVAGQEFLVLEAYAVPAIPFCFNTDVLSEEEYGAIVEYFTSSVVADNPNIFSDGTTVSRYSKAAASAGFIRTPDNYYDNFRRLIGYL
jgi:phosphonate transport system substrate-binding protein